MRRQGVTLLEVLLALTLLASVTALTGSWLVGASRISLKTQDHAEALQQWQALVSLLRDDVGMKVVVAEPVTAQDPAIALRLTTLNRTPGQEPGFTTVEYRVDRTHHRVIRRAFPLGAKGAAVHDRLVTTALEVSFQRMPNGAISLTGGVAGEKSDSEWRARIGGN